MTRKKVFISFDYDHDLELKNSLLGQSMLDESPFEIVDFSIKEAIDFNWKKFAREKIQRSDVVIFMCGHNTDTATGVASELSMTRELKKPYFLLAGRSDKNNKKPSGALTTDKIYSWTWDNLKALLSGKR